MILVDFSSLIIANAFAQRKDSIDEGLLRHMAINTILSVKKRFGAIYGEMYLCCDAKDYWRKDIYSYYKGHRAQAKEDSDFDWKYFFTCMDKIKAEIKEIFPYRMVEVPRCEADDVIGTLAYNAKEPTVIYAGDGDFIQCMANPRVKFWYTKEKKLYAKLTEAEAAWHLHEKICQGDKGDAIPNIFSNIFSFRDNVRQTACRQTYIEKIYKDGFSSFGDEVKKRYKENESLIDLKLVLPEYKEKIFAAAKEPVIGSKGKIFNYLTNTKLNKLGANFVKDLGDF